MSFFKLQIPEKQIVSNHMALAKLTGFSYLY